MGRAYTSRFNRTFSVQPIGFLVFLRLGFTTSWIGAAFESITAWRVSAHTALMFFALKSDKIHASTVDLCTFSNFFSSVFSSALSSFPFLLSICRAWLNLPSAINVSMQDPIFRNNMGISQTEGLQHYQTHADMLMLEPLNSNAEIGFIQF